MPYVLTIDILLSAVPVLVVAQPSSEIPEGLMNYPAYVAFHSCCNLRQLATCNVALRSIFAAAWIIKLYYDLFRFKLENI